jgi:non-ribosomal peptide synthetase component F
MEQPLKLANVRAKPYREEGEAGRLVFAVTERADGRTNVQVSSTEAELDARVLGELLRQYERLLSAVAEDPGVRIGSELELLTPAERERLGGGRAGGGGAGGHERGLHGLVAAAAQRAPDAVAFDGGEGDVLSYAELDARGRRLAGQLRARGIAVGAAVGIAIPPGGALLVAMLGVLAAGGVCVPLLDEAGLAGLPELDALVTSGGSAFDGSVPRVVVDLERDAEGLAGGDDRGVDDAVPPERIALVLRTAGVTGAPKAVSLTHATLCDGAMRQRDLQRLAAGDRVAQVPGRGVWSWALAPWAALAAGATVVSPARAPDPRSATTPSGWLEANGITVAGMGAGLASAALARPDALPAALRLLLVQGAGPLAVPDEAAARRRGTLVVQRQYGLLEGGGAVLSERVGGRGSGSLAADAPLAGEPLGARATVLDRHGNVVPAGTAGELQLDGPGLPKPVRTGDLARRRADGRLELLGRIADEVRYRGIRLNPVMREIETALTAHPGLQAATTCWVAASESLVACVVARRAEAPGGDELDAWLQRTMADWVLPATYAAVEAVPLRADGLPDRAALAASPAVAQAQARRAAGGAPQTRAERTLAEAWKQVLGVRDVGVHDNFFAAGGTLALGLELISRAAKGGVRVQPGQLLFQPTIAELARLAE